MATFRILLVALWSVLAIYTVFVIGRFGLGLLPIFFGDIARVYWPGQFNLDFLCLLILSALWTMWRARFSPSGLALGVVALVGGAGFLLPYLLILSVGERGDLRKVLLGRHA